MIDDIVLGCCLICLQGLGPTVVQIIPRMGVAFEVFEQLEHVWYTERLSE